MFVYFLYTYNEVCDWLANYYATSHWLVIFIKQPARKSSQTMATESKLAPREILNLFTVYIVRLMCHELSQILTMLALYCLAPA